MTVIDGSKVTLGNGQLATGTAVERDVMVEMSDGVRIACDVYRPRAEGEYPVLYAVSPYLKDAVYLPTMACYRYRETGKIANWVARGYVYVHADARGCGKSEGRYVRFSEDELRDLYEMIEWCGTQPWSTGKVGGFGESYYAMVQWAAAAQNPPHLACIAPYDGLTDYYRHSAWKGGIYSTTFESHWYGNSVRNRAYLDFVEKPDRDDFMAYDYLLDLIKHPTFDAFWQRRRFDVTAIKVPVFSIGNWNNAGRHLNGNIEGFMSVQGPRKLLINTGDAQQLFESPELEEQLDRWYAHWLKDQDTGIMEEPPVRIFVRNGEGYRDELAWPLARAQIRHLYLGAGPSGAADSLNDGTLTCEMPAAQAPPATSYTYPDPAWTFPGTGSQVRGREGLLHSTRRILTFTSAPFEQDTEITGPIELTLYASSTSEETQFIAKLMDVAPLSEEKAQAIATLDIAPPAVRVSEGCLKASHRALDPERSSPGRPYHTHTDPEPLVPGEIYCFAIEIAPTCWVVKQGHRLRLDLSALDGQSQYYLGQLGATDTFHHDLTHPSHLRLPVIA